ncbi:MAG: M16 family metallopeptidase [Vicinamibacterales bacterium]
MSRIDRSRLPTPGPELPFRFPRIARRVLGNGLELRAVTHRSVPVATAVLLVRGGSSVDPADRPGLTSITTGLLDEGSRGQSALDVADRLARIGGDFDLEVGSDAIVMSLTTLDRFVEEALGLLHDMVTAPNLASDDFDRTRKLRLERIRQLKDHPPAMAERAFVRQLYSPHAYGHLSIGDEMSLTAATVEESRALHATLFTPEGSTFVIVGDRSEDALLDRVTEVFDRWPVSPANATIDRSAALASPPAEPMARLGVVRRDGATQSELRIGRVCASRSTPDYHALLALNAILGGQFVSRLNMNLREDKGYTYGVRTAFELRRGRGPFVVQTSVATDRTAAAIHEALTEIRDIGSTRPATTDELTMAKASLGRGYPRAFETANQVARSVAQLALHGLPDTYFEEFVPRLDAVTIDDVTRVARQYLDLSTMATLIVGDLDRIGASLKALELGDVVLFDEERSQKLEART